MSLFEKSLLEYDIIDKAKNTDMIAFLEKEEGFSFKYKGNEYRCNEHDSLIVKRNKHRWYWNSREIGGNSAIDYLTNIRKMGFREAVLYLTGGEYNYAKNYSYNSASHNNVISNTSNEIKPQHFILPEQAYFANGKRNYSNIIAYLNRGRRIDTNIINTLIASGKIYQGVQYKGLHIVGYDGNGTAYYRFNDNRNFDDYSMQTLSSSPHSSNDTYRVMAISSKYIDDVLVKVKHEQIYKNNLVVALGYKADNETVEYASFRIANTNIQFRGEVSGSNKASGFLMPGSMDDCVYVFESFIDAMSHANLYNIKYGNKDAWKLHNRLALGGTADKALIELLKRKPAIKRICFCLDNDIAGRRAANTMSKLLRERGYEVYERYPNEKDYNEELVKIKTQIDEQYIQEDCEISQ